LGLIGNLGEVAHFSHNYINAYQWMLKSLQMMTSLGDRLAIVALLESIAYGLIDAPYS
jgi:hypothetical protein